MVALTRERAPGSDVVLGTAESLPFPAAAFTAVSMSIVLLFPPNPLAVLRECHRVMASDGGLAVYTTAEEMRGSPA
ncbi:MAG TPA: methyltransferase domain-containing protein, partial [Micromonosporaceae bacterium]|nr:methyltransferase domain-containing protein [Micromonosporaceae bacterium]